MASFGGRTDGREIGLPQGVWAAVGLPEKPPGAKRMASFGGRTDGRPHEHDLK
jgi:hypothetical protein